LKHPNLVRQLDVTGATALVVSNMIGTGVFTAGGYLAAHLGDARIILLAWLVGAICALFGSFCYSELGVNFPASGSEYVYLTRAYGPTWGFMSGWVSFFAGFSAPIAAAALAFADYLSAFFPALRDASHGVPQSVAAGVIALFTLLNCYGIRRAASIQKVLTGASLAVIVAFIVAGFISGTGTWSNFTTPAVRTSPVSIGASFFISLLFIYVSYSGWNAATYVAEEVQQPSRTLPVALTLGTAIVATLYIALNAVFIYGTPLESMKGVIAVGSLAASSLFGPNVGRVFSLLVAIALVSTVSAMVTIGPRLYYAMAKNGAFFSIAAKVDDRRHTPVAAILCQGICAMLMTVMPFGQLFLYIGFTLNFFAVLSVISIFVFRRRQGWHKLRVVSFAFPLVPAFFILVGVSMTIWGIVQQPLPSLAGALTVAAGAITYHLRSRAHDNETALGRV
jgi:basic amino acid/polyamine antiporter, APA family